MHTISVIDQSYVQRAQSDPHTLNCIVQGEQTLAPAAVPVSIIVKRPF